MKNNNTMTVANILAVKTCLNITKGTSIIILDENTNNIMASDLLFISDPFELAKKTRDFWKKQIGFNKEPKILHIEYPQTFHNKIKLSFYAFCTHIENEFLPQKTIRIVQKLRNTRVPQQEIMA